MNTTPKKSAVTLHQFEDILQPGEEILWRGHPKPGRLYQWRDVRVLLPGVALWLVIFALFLRQPMMCWVILLPHIFVGYYFFMVQFQNRQRLLRKTAYAITNRRLLANTPAAWATFTLDLDRITRITQDDPGDGTTTLHIHYRTTNDERSYPLTRLTDAETVYHTVMNRDS